MPASTATAAKVTYKVKADSIEACNCQHGCNCQFEGIPNEGKCEFIIGYTVKEGRFGTTALDGVKMAIVAKYPNAIHEGHGHVALFIDKGASDEQVNAVATIMSGQVGGMPWEAIAGTVERLDGPVRTSLEVSVDGERSVVRAPGILELQMRPLVDPVTGAEKEVHITYPKGGFFWNEARVGSTATMRADYGDLHISWPNRYAAIAEVNWTNER
jgi:hypothetical protein